MSATSPNNASFSNEQLWNTAWPVSELESVSECPVCRSSARTVLHNDLVDNVFCVAPGKWNLQHCVQCNSAYLNPRPTPESIGKAYGTYYTHVADSSKAENFAELGFVRKLRRMMSNGYLNYRYGTRRIPECNFGRWLAKFLPTLREVLDLEFRYLPRPLQGQRLLDIGCGNGDFLVSAREAGWDVSGIEPDPKAAEAARQRGIDVAVGTVELLAGESNFFDAITLSHVIEHVHEPKQLLQAVQRLLKPGGVVYIDTPNINSHGASLFKKNWRGIETPRHLVLFNPTSLRDLLLATGFASVQLKRRTAIRKPIYLSSLRLAAGYSPYGSELTRLGWIQRVKLGLPFVKTAHLEFVALSARKK